MTDKNIYICIEGIDGVGKETQSNLLKDYLIEKYSKDKVILQNFPNYNSEGCFPVKLYLNGNLSNTASEITAYQSSVLFAVDRFITMKKYEKEKVENKIFVLDRYVSSNMVHQGGKINDKKELNDFLDWLDNFEFNIMGIPKVDKVIYLKISVEKSLEIRQGRMNKNLMEKDIHESDINHLINASETGLYIAKKFGWDIIDCQKETGEMKSRQEIHEEIIRRIEPLLSNIK